MFKKLRGINVSYERQGFIRFTCLTYNDQSQEIRDKILNLCIDISGEEYQALFELMTTQKSAIAISKKHFVSERTLYRRRAKFYCIWQNDEQLGSKKLPEIGQI